MATGYRAALEAHADFIVKVDGDGQMDPRDIETLLRPLLEERAEYAKGCRFHDPDSLDAMPRPPGIPWESWLLAFPSYGFLLSVSPAHSGGALAAFAARGIDAAVVGRVDESRRLTLVAAAEQATLWDLSRTPLTGFGPGSRSP